MKSLSLSTITKVLLAISSFILLIPSRVLASDLPIFLDTFEDGNDDNWKKIHVAGPDTSNSWQITDGEYGLRLNTRFTVGNSIVTSYIPDDFAYELTMHIIEGFDKNFVFRYQEKPDGLAFDTAYEIHVTGNTGVNLSKFGSGTRQDPNIPSTFPVPPAYFNFTQGERYRWKVIAVGNSIKVYVRNINDEQFTQLFDVTDQNTPYLFGTLGVRVGTGVFTPVDVRYDDIAVYDLTPPPTPTPTPQHLPVEYISQRDYPDSSYDSIDKTIEQVGCALTAATMVLRYHGFDSMIDGATDITPESLNNWLVDNNGYSRQGGMNFQAVAKLTKLISAINNVGFDALDYKHLAKTQSSLVEQLLTVDRDPVIIDHAASDSSSGKHFSVARGVSDPGNAYVIHDPYYDSKTEFVLTDETVNSYRHFKPSNTDLSYISIEVPEELTVQMSDPSGNILSESNQTVPNSTFELAQPIFDNLLEENAGDPYWKAEIFDPISGMYAVSLTSESAGMFPVEVWSYGADGTDHYFYDKIFVAAGEPIVLDLVYDREGEESNAVLSHSIRYSYHQLIALLDWLADRGEIDTLRSHPVLANMLRVANGAHEQSWKLEEVVIDNFVKQLTRHTEKGWVSQEASSLILSLLP